MDLRVNGKKESYADGTSLAKLLELRGHRAKAVVTELNGEIVPHEAQSATILQEGDSLEIVQFVGGG
jgi:sulfur carrier protein